MKKKKKKKMIQLPLVKWCCGVLFVICGVRRKCSHPTCHLSFWNGNGFLSMKWNTWHILELSGKLRKTQHQNPELGHKQGEIQQIPLKEGFWGWKEAQRQGEDRVTLWITLLLLVLVSGNLTSISHITYHNHLWQLLPILILLFVEVLKFSKILFFSQRTDFCEGKTENPLGMSWEIFYLDNGIFKIN